MAALNDFYDYMPSTNREHIGLKITTAASIDFVTYDEETSINLAGDNKYMNDFGTGKFPTYLELFKAANLTNRIKKILTNTESGSNTPFKITKG